jgi:hypothetical protein
MRVLGASGWLVCIHGIENEYWAESRVFTDRLTEGRPHDREAVAADLEPSLNETTGNG